MLYRVFLGLTIGLVVMASARAQTAFPTRPINIVISAGVGGSTDIASRIVAQKMAAILKTNIVVENRPGANGQIGASYVLRQKNDGSKLYAGALGLLTLALTEKDVPFNPQTDFVPIGFFARYNMALIVSGQDKANTVKELADSMRADPSAAFFGSVGTPSSNGGGLAAAWMAHVMGVEVRGVPFRSTGAILTEISASRLRYAFASAVSVKGMLDSGHLKVLAVAADAEVPDFPGVPTVQEVGFEKFNSVNWDQWVGLFAPRDTPVEVLETLNEALNGAVEDSQVAADLTKAGLQPFRKRSLKEAKDFWDQQFAAWTSLLKQMKFME